MKQHISAEDLQELTQEQKERLREWWKPAFGDIFCNMETMHTDIAGDTTKDWINSYNSYGTLHQKKECLPLLTVNQMIEILQNKKMVTETLEMDAPKGLISTWSVWYANGDFPKEYEAIELCDALWQAVRQVL